jgi:PAS domain S-box-containing protein
MSADFSSNFDPRDATPEPERRWVRWKNAMAGLLRRDLDGRWGGQLLRIASDMILICDESLTILHHNRAFLKAVGYTTGSFRGLSLNDFFPSEERAGVAEAFADWRRGHAAGMRFQAGLLTTKGRRPGDFRVVRSRNRAGSFLYYLVAREMNEAKKPAQGSSEERSDPFFRGLPVAAWRTDSDFRITHAFGSLWPELGAASEDLVGELVGHRHGSLLPGVLQSIDCSDTAAGMSLQTEADFQGQRYSVTVEPFLDAGGRVVGTVGILRRAAHHSAVDRLYGETVSAARHRHHGAPVVPSLGTRIVNARVPKFNGPAGDETEPLLSSDSLGSMPGLPS